MERDARRRRGGILSGDGGPPTATPQLRLAGTGRLAPGGRVTWTVADGARGRRWRTMLVDDGALVGTVLLETAPDGSVMRLEATTATGLLTLHPADDGLHGNLVRSSGVRHLALPWSDLHVLIVAGAPATAAAAARTLRARLEVGEGRSVPGVLVEATLDVRAVTFRVVRIGPRGWRFVVADTGAETGVTLDLDGLPSLVDGTSWPLELEHGA